MNKFRFIILWLTIFSFLSVFAEEVGDIYSISYPDLTEINFGPCFIGDSLVSDFMLDNKSGRRFLVNPVSPSFAISRSPKEKINDEFRSFRSYQNNFPISIAPNSFADVHIQFKADTNTVIFPTGWYNAVLELGFLDDADTGTVLQKTFDLKAKKTKKFIDGFEDVLFFDSVYVNPPLPIEKVWRVKSTKIDDITILTQKFTLISQKLTLDEFLPEFYSVNPNFRRKSEIINWNLSYSPLNLGSDTGIVELIYKPFPESYPDSIQSASVTTIGTGVMQDLKLVSANFQISGDTIFVGNQPANKPFSLSAQIYNNGNIPFGSINEKLLSETEFEAIYKNKLTDKKHLLPKDTSSINLEIIVNDLGNFTLQYQLESDIIFRNIKFPPFDAKLKTFYIVGKSVEPVIQLLNDTVDFEKVYHYLPYCESSKDTTIFINNTGNDTLIISKIEIINQIPNFSFSTENPEIKIYPYGRKSIQIIFEPTLSQNYSADMIIHNNSAKSKYIIHLKGSSSTPAATSIHIDSIKAKPGSVLHIPILIDSNIVFANEFKDTLVYNRSLLHYAGYITENTASTLPIEFIEVSETLDGRLYLHIKKPGKSRFQQNKSLIILQFNTFLGNAQSTEIAFSSPRFSNEICEFALNLPKSNIQNGVFSIDSICGINLKAFPKIVKINSIFPNPVEDKLNLNFECLVPIEIDFRIYDIFGNIVKKLSKQSFASGPNQITFDLNGFQPGNYYIRILDSEMQTSTIQFILSK